MFRPARTGNFVVALAAVAAWLLVPATANAHLQYVVRPGDTLTTIAGAHGTTVAALARENKLDPAAVLQVGRRLRIPHARRRGGSQAAKRAVVRDAINRWARIYGLDARLVRAIAWQESGYQSSVVSRAGASGVMQVTPATWEFVETVLVGRRIAHTMEGNVRVGVTYFHHLVHRFAPSVRLALGAYYQGPASVRRHGLYRETRRYVANVLALRSRA